MNATLKIWQYFVALMISALGATMSYYFLKPDSLSAGKNILAKPIASLIKKTSLVEKKASDDISWSVLDVGADLYQGEMIRTSDGSFAKVKFTENGSVIDIEEDSMVVIELDKEKFSLNVLEGSLFVDKAQSGSGQLELKSGDKTISLTSGQLSINKTKGNDFEVNVLEGNAQASSAGGQSVDLSKGMAALISKEITSENLNLKITYPDFNQDVYVTQSEPFKIKWVPFSGSYAMRLLAGQNKNDLVPVQIPDTASSVGEITYNRPAGTFYWRLEAVSNNKQEQPVKSLVYKNNLVPIRKPALIKPTDKSTLEVLQNNFSIEFVWSGSSAILDYRFVLATDPEFKKVIDDRTIKNVSYNYLTPISSGTYYWKVSPIIAGFSDQLTTEGSFELKVKELFPPELKYPEDQAKFYVTDNANQTFQWEKIKGINKYQINIYKDNKTILKRETAQSQYSTNLKDLGTYSWSISSIGKQDKVSTPSEQRIFYLVQPSSILFENFEENYYISTNTRVSFQWKALSQDFQGEYRVRIWSKSGNTKLNRITADNSFSFSPTEEGAFKIKVQAYDQFNNLITESETRNFEVQKAAKLVPPQILTKSGKDNFVAPMGSIRFRVSPQEAAMYYLLQIKEKNGNIVVRQKERKPEFTVRKLLPGDYYMEIQVEDRFERKSEWSPSYVLTVPDTSKIEAPSFKKVKVK